VEPTEYSCASARSGPLDVDKAMESNVDATSSREIGTSNMQRALDEVHFILSTLAPEIRDTGPYSMNSLDPINESLAAVLGGVHVRRVDIVGKDIGGGPETLGSRALGDLLGFPRLIGDLKGSVAAKARILSCLAEEAQAGEKAVNRGLTALRAKEHEIVPGRPQDA